MKTRPWRELVGPALFEAAFVVLGVVLALAANEWRQHRVAEARAAAALEEIVRELETNRAAVAAAAAYHRGLAERIQGAEAGGETLRAGDFPRGFVAPARLYRTAWSSAATTGSVADMPYGTVLGIVGIRALLR